MRETPKSIQIEYDLFLQMADYITSHVDPYDSDLKNILFGIRKKLAAIENRDTYTALKTGKAPSDVSVFYDLYHELMSRIDILHL